MSRLADRILQHPVHERLTAVRGKTAQLSDDSVNAAEERVEEAVGRIPAALDYITGLIEAADPQLLPPSALDELVPPLDRMISALDALEADPDQAVALDSAADDLLNATARTTAATQFPAEIGADAREAFGAALREKAEGLGQEIAAIKGRIDDLNAEQNRITEELNEAHGNRRSELQGEFDRIQEAVNNEKTRLDQLVPQFEKQFGESQQERADDWASLRGELSQEITGTRERLEAKVTETETSFTEKANEGLTEIDGIRDKVESLYRVISDTGTAGAFADEAKAQKGVADIWRRVAIGGGIVTILLAAGAVAFAALSNDGAAVAHLASLAVAAAAGGLTAYAAKQSGHHRDREEESKRLELELTAFGPFVADMPDPAKAREEFAGRLFKGAERVRSEETSIGKDQVSLLQTIVEQLLKLRT